MHYLNRKIKFDFIDIPDIKWSEFESLIVKAGGADGEMLHVVVVKLSAEAGTGIVPSGQEYQYISDIVSKIRQSVKKRKYQILMNCFDILCNYGELSIEELNEFLESNDIMYRAMNYGLPGGINWEKVQDENNEFGKKMDYSKKDNILNTNTDIERKELGVALNNNGIEENISTKIFITHSSKDKEYVLVLTEFLRNIRIPNKCIICTLNP